MTTLGELCSVLDAIGLPWTNTEWTRDDDAVAPFIVLRKTGGTAHGANDATWCVVAEYDIELYTLHRDYDLESAITDALDSAGIYFSDGGVWPLPQEGLFEAVTTVTVREN